MREIYLPAFEEAVKAQPDTVMCSYNRLNASASYGFDDLFVGCAAATRHFEVQTCFYSFNTVVERVPVADDNAFKAPFVAKYIGQQSLVVRQI